MCVVASCGASRAASQRGLAALALAAELDQRDRPQPVAPFVLGAGGDGGVGRLQRALGVVELELGQRDQAVQLGDLRRGGERDP